MKKIAIIGLTLASLSTTLFAHSGMHKYQVKTYVIETSSNCLGHWIEGEKQFCVDTSESYLETKLCTTCGEYGEVIKCRVKVDTLKGESNSK